MDEKRNEFQKKALSLQKLGQAIAFQSELMLQHRGAFTCQETVEKADRATEKARVLVRELILESGHPRAIEITEEILAETVPVSMGFTDEGWFWLHIPLLPPKKTAGSAKYVRSYLYPAMQKYFANLDKRQTFSQCVVIFLHRYDPEYPEQEYRDQDNIETNMVVDTLALYLMEDDGAKRCWHSYFMLPGEVTRTEVYLLPKSEMGKWQEKHLSPYLEEGAKP